MCYYCYYVSLGVITVIMCYYVLLCGIRCYYALLGVMWDYMLLCVVI